MAGLIHPAEDRVTEKVIGTFRLPVADGSINLTALATDQSPHPIYRLWIAQEFTTELDGQSRTLAQTAAVELTPHDMENLGLMFSGAAKMVI